MDQTADIFNRHLNKILDGGVSQADVAKMINLSPQHLSDLKCGRRPLSELVARRFGAAFNVDFRLLLNVSQIDYAASQPPANRTMLPLLVEPVEGDPVMHPKWDGAYAEVPSAASYKLKDALQPYVLQFCNVDYASRLHQNDHVLISQGPNELARIVVIKQKAKCFLARADNRTWIRLRDKKQLSIGCHVVGHCLAVLWSPLA